MAAAETSDPNCPLCLGIYSSPVMLSCGHTFCQDCIGNLLDIQEKCQDYSCPVCEKPFWRRPVLYRDTTLHMFMENSKSSQPNSPHKDTADRPGPSRMVRWIEDVLYHNHIKSTSREPMVSGKCQIHNDLHHYCLADDSFVCVSCYMTGRFGDQEKTNMNNAPEKMNSKLINIIKELANKTDELLLDVNTAANDIVLLSDFKTAIVSHQPQGRPPIPTRFCSGQVFGNRAFNKGQYFWEMETSKDGDWAVGLAYPSIPRTGEESYIGYNPKSWCLQWDDEYLSAAHNSEAEVLCIDCAVRRVGIYLNYGEGQISFFQMSDPLTHLHTFTDTFSEPLLIALSVSDKGWVRFTNQDWKPQTKCLRSNTIRDKVVREYNEI